MNVYLKGRNNIYCATGVFNKETGTIVVKKGSSVSKKISESKTFRGCSTIISLRKKYVENGVLIEDLAFNSPSTAANFVTGVSSNGMRVWKNEKGVELKKCLTTI